jgi:hypothetical protein
LLPERRSLDGFEKYLSAFYLRLEKLKQLEQEGGDLSSESVSELVMLRQVIDWLTLHSEIESNRN